MSDPAAAVFAHVEAFNARDADAVVATFADDAVFANADDVVIGRAALDALFRDAFSAPLHATLRVQGVVVQGDTAACELLEVLTYGGTTFEVPLAGFFTVRDGRLARVRIYRDAPPE